MATYPHDLAHSASNSVDWIAPFWLVQQKSDKGKPGDVTVPTVPLLCHITEQQRALLGKTGTASGQQLVEK